MSEGLMVDYLHTLRPSQGSVKLRECTDVDMLQMYEYYADARPDVDVPWSGVNVMSPWVQCRVASASYSVRARAQGMTVCPCCQETVEGEGENLWTVNPFRGLIPGLDSNFVCCPCAQWLRDRALHPDRDVEDDQSSLSHRRPTHGRVCAVPQV